MLFYRDSGISVYKLLLVPIVQYADMVKVGYAYIIFLNFILTGIFFTSLECWYPEKEYLTMQKHIKIGNISASISYQKLSCINLTVFFQDYGIAHEWNSISDHGQ
jgi:hypothetical protein